MVLAAVIAEFNPFHNGHAHLLARARASGATHVAAVMSGNFTQRGEPAIFDKWTRARAALRGGADLVAELPLPFAVAGAQRFARGGCAIAAALGAKRLVFGSECGALPPLQAAARAVADEAVGARLRERMAGGTTFAAARAQAVNELYGPDAAQTLRTPNNALAVEYLLALEGTGIEPMTFARVGAAHDAAEPADGCASASALRQCIARGEPVDRFVPAAALEEYARAPLCLPGAMELPLLARLRAMDDSAFAALPDVSEGIERRLIAAARRARSLDELYALVKTKRYPLARVRRLALCAYLGAPERLAASAPPYVRVLGCTARGRELLGGAHPLPVNASLARLARVGGEAGAFARLEAAAGDQYALLQSPRGGCGADWSTGFQLLDG